MPHIYVAIQSSSVECSPCMPCMCNTQTINTTLSLLLMLLLASVCTHLPRWLILSGCRVCCHRPAVDSFNNIRHSNAVDIIRLLSILLLKFAVERDSKPVSVIRYSTDFSFFFCLTGAIWYSIFTFIHCNCFKYSRKTKSECKHSVFGVCILYAFIWFVNITKRQTCVVGMISLIFVRNQ